MILGPAVDQPMHVSHDRSNVFRFLLCGIGVVHADVANAAKLARNPKIETNRFRVADVQIAIRFGRKTGNDLLVFPRPKIFGDNVANEVRRPFCFSCHCNETKLSANAQIDNFSHECRRAKVAPKRVMLSAAKHLTYEDWSHWGSGEYSTCL
jgi:hypothetical protein